MHVKYGSQSLTSLNSHHNNMLIHTLPGTTDLFYAYKITWATVKALQLKQHL